MTAAVVLYVLASAGAAFAQDANEPTVRGSVTGTLSRGQNVRFQITATHPDGFAAIATVGSSLELRGAALETLTYEPADSKLNSGTASVLAGTGDQLDGRFFEVSGTGITITTSGNEMSLEFGARILAEVPDGARFRFISVDQDGEETSTSLRAAVPKEENGGLSIGTVILAIIGALIGGGFIGSQLMSARRPRSSVYGNVARRIEHDRSSRTGGNRT